MGLEFIFPVSLIHIYVCFCGFVSIHDVGDGGTVSSSLSIRFYLFFVLRISYCYDMVLFHFYYSVARNWLHCLLHHNRWRSARINQFTWKYKCTNYQTMYAVRCAYLTIKQTRDKTKMDFFFDAFAVWFLPSFCTRAKFTYEFIHSLTLHVQSYIVSFLSLFLHSFAGALMVSILLSIVLLLLVCPFVIDWLDERNQSDLFWLYCTCMCACVHDSHLSFHCLFSIFGIL